ncbi:MAG: hypothetical protein HY539_06490 [Deltaproteobacteria bacterium]|nr:hypothetical protein [Deltaproteobacteria bacterium]
MLPVWNLALAILTFLLTLLGTFLTRSGILDSVHSFTESHIGPYFLVFIGIALVGSLALLFWRGEKIQAEGRFDSLLSLEFLLLFNNLLFLSFCFIVFLGTFYPLLLEAVTGKRISIGEPYFNQMSAPITSLLLLLMGIGLLVPWKRGDLKTLFRQSVVPLILSLVVGFVSFLFGGRAPWVLAIVLLASYAFFVMGAEVFRLAPKRNFFQLLLDNPRRYGGFIAHTGALLIVVAVSLSSTYEKDQEVTLKRGESVKVSSYRLSLDRLTGEETPQRFEVKAHLQISRDEVIIGELTPQMNYYPGSREPIGSPAVRSSWKEDLYTTLIQVDPKGENASFRVILTPAVIWIWVGGLMVMSGGLLAMLFRRPTERRL